MFWLTLACNSGSAIIEKLQESDTGSPENTGDTFESTPPDDTALPDEECLKEGSLSLETEIEWFIWGGTEFPTAYFTPEVTSESCDSFVASAIEEWLVINMAPDGSSLTVTINPNQLHSGKHSTTISIWDSNFNDILVEIPVSVSALVSPLENVTIQKRALVIGVDGLDGEEMYNADIPTLNLLQEGGLWTRDARTQLSGDTSSGPGWTSILTGVEVTDHWVTSNGGYSGRNPDYPTFVSILKEEGYQTAVSIQWNDIFDILESTCCDASNGGDQQEVTDWVVERLLQGSSDDVIFVHLDDVDHAGHAYGFTADESHYVDAVEEADQNIGQMLDAILDGPNIANEEWLLIVISDHGGDTAGTHGTIGLDYQKIPLIVAGSTIEKGLLPVGHGNHMDTHPTILDFFGLNPYSEGMDGISWVNAPELECDDGIDNEPDGLIDCADPDCQAEQICIEQNCSDGIDNEMDGLIDCVDPDCQTNISCLECDPNDLGSDFGNLIDNVYPGENLYAGSCGGETGNEELFTWTAPLDGRYILNTMQWYRDTVLYAYDSECDGTELACNESPSSTARSVISLDLLADQIITVVIDTDGSSSTETGLSIYPESNACTTMFQSTDSWSESFSHVDNAYVGSCVPMIAPVWWEWTAPINGNYSFDTSSSDFDTVLYILDGCNGTELACNDDQGSLYTAGTNIALLAGDTVTIGVGSFAGRASSGTVGMEISN